MDGLHLMRLLALIGWAAAMLWLMWGLYVLVMGLYRAQLAGRINRWIKLLAAPYLVAGVLIDCALNLTVFSVLFLEAPRELLVTRRLNRHINGSGWRRRIARAVCTKLLDLFDPTGAHCK